MTKGKVARRFELNFITSANLGREVVILACPFYFPAGNGSKPNAIALLGDGSGVDLFLIDNPVVKKEVPTTAQELPFEKYIATF